MIGARRIIPAVRITRFTLPIVAALLAATAAHASAITDSLLRDRLIGAWADGGDCRDGGLVFRDDGSFTFSSGDSSGDLAGTFDIKDGRLAGKAGDRVMPVVPVLFNDDGWLILGPDLLERCKTPPPTPARP